MWKYRWTTGKWVQQKDEKEHLCMALASYKLADSFLQEMEDDVAIIHEEVFTFTLRRDLKKGSWWACHRPGSACMNMVATNEEKIVNF